ncbi:MAG: ferritin [Victivallales bacterium]|nr:ferritin [Victivallales bacterium]
MDAKMEKALNDQINFELYSSYIYMAMSSYLKSLNLNGFANWMEIQVQEEVFHATKLYNFLHERGGNVEFQEIPKPRADWNSPKEVFQHAYEHEQTVTDRINNLVNLAHDLKDHATNAHLQWFVNEQVEEESSVLGVLQQIKLSGNSTDGLFMLDRELGQRVYTPPQDTKNN